MKNNQSVSVKSGTRDKIEGSGKSFAGKVKEGTGKAIGNPKLEARGRSEQIEGKVQKKVGEIKKVFGM
jgi:uncharacterized protein YjbJ (UPF0337 family)